MVLSPVRVAGGALALLVLSSWTGAPRCAPVPDSLALAGIQATCDAAPRLRITTTRAVFEAARVRVDADGVVIPGAERAALLTVGEVPGPERRLPWRDVERLDSEHSRAGQLALLAGLLALVPVTISIARHGPDAFVEGDNLGVIFGVGVVVASASLGGLIGASQPALRPIYP